MCKSCDHCLITRCSPQKSVVSWPVSTEPFATVHIDHFNLRNHDFLVIIDYYSKWIDAYLVKNLSSATTIEKLRECFARFGLPITVISDNGSSLVSDEIEGFFRKNGIRHIKTPPYNPQSNGPAECSVKTVKNKLKSALNDPNNVNVNIQTLLCRFLLLHNNIPNCTSSLVPATLMFGRKLRSRLDLLKPSPLLPQPTPSHSKIRDFQIGDSVIVRDYRDVNHQSWVRAEITKRLGNVVYLCKLKSGQMWKRHSNQIRSAIERPEPSTKDNNNTNANGKQVLLQTHSGLPIASYFNSTITTTPNTSGATASPSSSRPKRQIKAPARYRD